jgi:hypothetical protein
MLQDTLHIQYRTTAQSMSQCTEVENLLVMLSDTGSHTRSQRNQNTRESTAQRLTKCNQLSTHATLIPWILRTQEQHTSHVRCGPSGCLRDSADNRETDTAQWTANRATLVSDQLSMEGGAKEAQSTQ